jgi:oligopeptide transport system substrate-binding protein
MRRDNSPKRDGFVENLRGEPFPIVDCLFSTNNPRYRNIALALADMWRRRLGVRVELRGKDAKAFKEDLKSGNFMVGRGSWYGDYGDPTTFLDIFRSGDGNNDRGYANPRVDDMLDAAARETDPQRRMDILEACEQLLFEEELPMLVLYQNVQLYMYDPARLRGISPHPRLVQYLWRLEAVESADGRD